MFNSFIQTQNFRENDPRSFLFKLVHRIIPSSDKNDKTCYVWSICGVFVGGVGGYLGVFVGGFWRVFGVFLGGF